MEEIVIMGGNQEIIAFSEIHEVNIEIYERITLFHHSYTIKNKIQQSLIRLFLCEHITIHS